MQKEKKKVKVTTTQVADDVIKICFAFSKLKEFKFDAEIKKHSLGSVLIILEKCYFEKQLVSFLICVYIVIFTNIAKHLCFRFIN